MLFLAKAGSSFAAVWLDRVKSRKGLKSLKNKKTAETVIGAEDRTRTGTRLLSRDFKSLASANSATSANGGANQIRTGE